MRLDSVLESHPELLDCAVSCVHCGIRFFTHPRNAGRRDLRCPFGCREHHRRQRSTERSTAYYQTASGKRKKKRLNGRRQQAARSSDCPPDQGLAQQESPPEEPQLPSDGLEIGSRTDEEGLREIEGEELTLEGVVLRESNLAKSPVLPYVRMLIRLIEGIELTCCEVAELLRRAMRQHSIAYRRRPEYVLGFLHQHPP